MIPTPDRRSRRFRPVAVAALLLLVAVVRPASATTDLPPPPCDQGVRYAVEGRFQEARQALLECLDARGEDLRALSALAMMAVEEDLRAEALDWSARAVTAFPDSADAHYWQGRALAAVDDVDAARESWEAALARDTDHGPTLRALSSLMLATGDERSAYGLLSHLVRVEGPDPWALKTLSGLARRRALWGQALAHWDMALKVTNPSGADLRMASELAILAADTTYALLSSQEAVRVDPGPESWAVFGEALFSAGRIGQAVGAFERTLELDPDMTRARFHLANACEILDRSEDAEAHFRRYVAQEPGDPAGFFNLAVHLDKRGRTREALQMAEQARLLAPAQVGPSMLVAGLLEKENDDDALIAVIDEMLAGGVGSAEQLTAWRGRVQQRLDFADAHAGQVMLMHIVTPDSTALRLIQEDLVDGVDFSVIATRYSVGPTAGKGGDIGWVDPDDMVDLLRDAIRDLEPGQVSPAVREDDLFHFFKRVR